jgi:hypothetical protein
LNRGEHSGASLLTVAPFEYEAFGFERVEDIRGDGFGGGGEDSIEPDAST